MNSLIVMTNELVDMFNESFRVNLCDEKIGDLTDSILDYIRVTVHGSSSHLTDLNDSLILCMESYTSHRISVLLSIPSSRFSELSDLLEKIVKEAGAQRKKEDIEPIQVSEEVWFNVSLELATAIVRDHENAPYVVNSRLVLAEAIVDSAYSNDNAHARHLIEEAGGVDELQISEDTAALLKKFIRYTKKQ